jgi:hypothetical protein
MLSAPFFTFTPLRMRCDYHVPLDLELLTQRQMIAPPKFSIVDMSLIEFLYFLEDIGTLGPLISVDNVSPPPCSPHLLSLVDTGEATLCCIAIT